ncbi:hypothetical protein D3C74_455990 [compost metagenome]
MKISCIFFGFYTVSDDWQQLLDELKASVTAEVLFPLGIVPFKTVLWEGIED